MSDSKAPLQIVPRHKPEVFRRAIALLLDGHNKTEILRILQAEFGDDAPTSWETMRQWDLTISPAQREDAQAMQQAIAHIWATRTLAWSQQVDTTTWSPERFTTVYGIVTDKAHNIDRIEVSRQRNATEQQKLSLFEELLRTNTHLLHDRITDAIDAEVLPLPELKEPSHEV